MSQAHRQNGFVFRINSDDHEPSHVHVFRAGEECLIYIGDEDNKPSIRKNKGMKEKDAFKALRIVCEQQEKLIEKWRSIHG